MIRNDKNSIKILLKDFNTMKKFCDKVVGFKSDVNIYYNEVNFYDAKSIMAIYAMEFSRPCYIEIMTNSDEERSKFFEEMDEFRVE